jgi:hypothetical protein
MKYFFMQLLFCSGALAQSTLSGTLYADDVQGFMVIGCLLDFAINDCDYDKSPFVEVNQGGPSYPFVLDAPDGQYLVIAWRDTNSNGTLEDDGSDELVYYTDAAGEATMVTPPASDIILQMGEVRVDEAQSNPLTQTPSQNPPAQNPSENQTGSAATNLTPTGNFPAEYVGVWVDNTATYNINTQGSGFGVPGGYYMAGGFNGGGRVLKIAGDGSYTFYQGDLSSVGCLTQVTSQGVVGIDDETFTFYPTQKREVRSEPGNSKFIDCEISDLELTPTPESYPLESTNSVYVAEYNSLYGWKTYQFSLLVENEYWFFQKVKGTMPAMPTEQPLPSYFVIGTDLMYSELISSWFVSGDEATTADFYDASTGQVTATDYASSLSFSNDGSYELVVYRPDLLNVPACTRNVLLVERGTTQFAIDSRDDYNNKYVGGDVVLTPTVSTLTDEIVNCDSDGYKQTVSLPLIPRYLDWKLEMPNTLSGQASSEDTFTFSCPSEYVNESTEWLFMFCPGRVASAVFHYNRN